ncbi:MAG: alpha/beta hydrolase [Sporichthyaceae bacterium]
MQSLILASAGARLVAEYHPAEARPPAAFVVVHGWGSQAPRGIPAALAAAGYPALAFDLRAHHRSSGILAMASRRDWVEDVVGAYRWLSGRHANTPIGLVGASFGAYLSLLATVECEVASLSLRVPVNFVDDGFAEPFLPQTVRNGERNLGDRRPADSHALRALRAFDGPVQIVDADGDQVIPTETVAAYEAVVPAERLTRATLNGPHHLATPELRATYIDWLVAWAGTVHPA